MFFPPWAVHISDGILTWPWLAGGFGLAAVLVFMGSRRVRDEEIARVALMTAAFFVASLIHIRVGPTSVHLLLTGLVGVVLGWRAALAIPVGLFLQAALLQHGGFTTLGVNSCVMVLPALLAWWLFGALRRVPWIRQPWFRSGLVVVSILVWTLSLLYCLVLLAADSGLDGMLDAVSHALAKFHLGLGSTPTTAPQWALALTFHPLTLAVALPLAALAAWMERRLENAPEFPVGLLVGEVAALATTLLNFLVLWWGGQEDWYTLALLTLVAHLPIAVVEGVVLGFTVGFLAQVKPEMLGWEQPATDRPGGRNNRAPGWLATENPECSADPLP
jgi:cobalt/nickel transport system permease protein